MSGRIERFSKPSGTTADYVALERAATDRMEKRAEAFMAERDHLKAINAELLAALAELLSCHVSGASGSRTYNAREQARAAIAKARA